MEQEIFPSDEEIQERFKRVADSLSDFRKIPIATYRVQLNREFKFSDLKAIIPYLHELGISDVYASPYFKAPKGSSHGYDILDHNQFDREVGTANEYDRLIEEMRAHRMGQILDIVPNHMSIASEENLWWMDVLENGPSSAYAEFFDIDWKPVKDELENKVLLPILGDQYGNILENQELQLEFEQGAFFISYYDRKLPVAPVSYTKILKYGIDDLEKKMGKENPNFQELLSILTAIDHLPAREEKDREKIEERRREKEVIKRRLLSLCNDSREISSFIDSNALCFNGKKGNRKSFDLLDDLLKDQVYRLSYWQVAMEEINYRRFFDINELAAIRMENPIVFKESHRLIFQLIREGKVTGFRVDHVDGLYNPTDYLYRLQKSGFVQFCLRDLPAVSNEAILEEIGRAYDEALSQSPSRSLQMPIYVIGEKILIRGERLPEDWPIYGTTGYGFLNLLSGLFIDAENAKVFENIYSRFIGAKANYQEMVYEKKKLIMEVSMSGEINALGHYLNGLSEKDRHTRDFTLRSLTAAIVETIACFPVYRTYVRSYGVNEKDRRYIEQAISRAKRENPAMSATIFDFLQKILLLQYPEEFQETDRKEWLDFVMKFQQVTGPVMAKGLEDTVFYLYNRFISLNEVGGNPERFGTSLDAFHGQNIERAKNWPHSLLATSTHDTKRSEDVRARLNVISEIPGEWRQCVSRWSRVNKRRKKVMDGQWIPDRNEEYLLYQTLTGAWPVHEMDKKEVQTFKERIRNYMIKAAREAKVNTSWISPNAIYEEALLAFIDAILSSRAFVSDLFSFCRKASYIGMFNSLSQTLLKITSPGIPDFYQGSEIWNFSLVDPDNRGSIDFRSRKELLVGMKKKMESPGADLKELARCLIQEWRDGSPKLYIIFKALNYRKENALLFQEGSYLPLETKGDLREHLCAFARQKEQKTVIIAVPRFLTHLIKTPEEMPLGNGVWGDSGVVLPDEITGETFRNLFTGEMIEKVERNGQGVIPVGKIFANFPVAMMEKV
jgi:(1->4)-alpha-D-glucan 1-alpha-D-glucosylmutase